VDDWQVEGRAYVFTETNGVWKQLAELVGSDTGHYDYFGCSVAISGTTVAVGAYMHGDTLAPPNWGTEYLPGPGSAYVFEA
jgi:hypothetical protein